jgi:hypothetical protein
MLSKHDRRPLFCPAMQICVLQQATRRARPARHQLSAAETKESSESESLSRGSNSGTEDSDTRSEASEEDEEEALAGAARRRRNTAASRRSRRAGQQVQAGDAAAAGAAGPGLQVEPAAAPPAAAAGAGQQQQQHVLHKPHSHLLVGDLQFGVKKLFVSSQLCTDLAELYSEGSCPVQVSVVVHPAGWDVSDDCKAYILQQQQQADITHSFGPFTATMKLNGWGRVHIFGLTHSGQLTPYSQQDNPHAVVLQERVSSCQSNSISATSSVQITSFAQLQPVAHSPTVTM